MNPERYIQSAMTIQRTDPRSLYIGVHALASLGLLFKLRLELFRRRSLQESGVVVRTIALLRVRGSTFTHGGIFYVLLQSKQNPIIRSIDENLSRILGRSRNQFSMIKVECPSFQS
jgi:hypothetical protein